MLTCLCWTNCFWTFLRCLWILPSRLAALPHFPPCGTICAPFARSPSFPLPESSCNPLWVYLSKLKCMEGGQYAVNEMQLINDYNIKYNGFVPCVWHAAKGLLPHQEKRELNQPNVFERRTSTANEPLSLLIFLDDTKFVLLSVFTLIETIWLNVCSKSWLKCAKKSPLPVNVLRSKTPLLKLTKLTSLAERGNESTGSLKNY